SPNEAFRSKARDAQRSPIPEGRVPIHWREVPPTNPILFFDGVCNLCNATIDFLVRRDRARTLRYAPLQGETAARLLGDEAARVGQGDPATIVLARGGRVHRR